MKAQVKVYEYNGRAIAQLEKDWIAPCGTLLPAEYCNANQIAAVGGKRVWDYIKAKATKDYLAGASTVIGIPPDELIIRIENGRQVTYWIHPEVAHHLGRTASRGFERWIVLTFQVKGFLDPVSEAEPEQAEDPTEVINLLLTGHESQYWRTRFGLPEQADLHSGWGNQHQARVRHVLALAEAKVQHEGLDPIAATKQAIADFHYDVWDEDRLLGRGDKSTYFRNYRRKLRQLED